MSDLTNKDAEQDTKIAVIDSTLENSLRRIEMVHQRIDREKEDLDNLRQRVRKLDVGCRCRCYHFQLAITIIGIALAAEARPAHSFTEDSLTGAPCATEVSLSSVVTEISVKPSEEQE